MTNIKGRRQKTIYRETKQKNPERRTARITFLKSQRSDTKSKTFKACMKV